MEEVVERIQTDFAAAFSQLVSSGVLPKDDVFWSSYTTNIRYRGAKARFGDLSTPAVLPVYHHFKGCGWGDCKALGISELGEAVVAIVKPSLADIATVWLSPQGFVNVELLDKSLLVIESDVKTSEPEEHDDVVKMRPIGYLSSCWKEKFGTPRQGAVVPTARAKITLSPHISEDSLIGLEQYSHVWVLFMFHWNPQHDFKPKIKPPRLNGEKVGVFATRSPHRGNDIGMSVVKLEKVVGNTVHLSGVDIIDQTPV